ncbi:MBL fold metallo-hydrolase [bacterium]|nr:MBL fold metallo-hydrolase [candidate division CSSED10-310 bacterium]
MRVCVLGSGSAGNSVLVSSSRSSILIDIGFSAKNTLERLSHLGCDPRDIRAILLTHEHIDHIRGVGIIARKFHIPVFATAATLLKGHAVLGNLPERYDLSTGMISDIEDFKVNPFSIPHDAADPVGYIIENENTRIGVCTDLGYPTGLVREKIKSCDALILESNHDVKMLMAGPYPWHIKQRIRSRVGHLSNDDASELLKSVWSPKLKHVLLAHLSKENNIPELASMAAEEALFGCSIPCETNVHMTYQEKCSLIIDVSSRILKGGISDD